MPQQAGTIPGDLQLTLTPSDSHPIAATLGFAATSKPIAAFWARQDFTVGPASVLWETP
jgi:hypothetical protein